MDNDKIEKTIEIILQNQAQFYTDLQKMQEVQKESEKRIGALERAIVSLGNVTMTTAETVNKLSETVDKLTERVDKLTEKVDLLADTQKETDERLNAVILMAEKFFSRNGNSEGKQ